MTQMFFFFKKCQMSFCWCHDKWSYKFVLSFFLITSSNMIYFFFSAKVTNSDTISFFSNEVLLLWQTNDVWPVPPCSSDNDVQKNKREEELLCDLIALTNAMQLQQKRDRWERKWLGEERASDESKRARLRHVFQHERVHFNNFTWIWCQ